MKKNNTHDYAVSAFMMYAKEKKPQSSLLLEALKKSRRKYLAYASQKNCLKLKARKLSNKTAAIRRLYLDIYAIEKSILNPKTERDRLILKCVEKVYFAAAIRQAEKGKKTGIKGLISGLVLSCSMEENLSPTTVYDYLKEAANRFCSARGLRCDGEISIKDALS